MEKQLKAVCFGEVLFDVFPDKERIGGAPLNVASRLSSLGIQTELISQVGKDEKGRQLLDYLKENRVGTACVYIHDQFPTGVVNVSLSKSGGATYEIAFPAAWDKIKLQHEQVEIVQNADAFIFGSLACIDEVSRETLFSLLENASYKVLDFNLRPPHYTKELLLKLLQKADFIKLNDDELYEIAHMMNSPYHSLDQNLLYIAKNSAAKTICVTKGSHGAVLYSNRKLFYNSGFKITVEDTVGAGDSFLAALLSKILKGEREQDSLDYACAVGALVASKKGANPALDPQMLDEFLKGTSS
ncbi:carbohydrate kinase family protein [Salinimicrobium sp. GXAS 041]|uniref:carbohydrate kinase family protein n=1 Tax=Salinimicrobium sp. GXAS 041 TaxID=3400806 RepID=UPI003C7621E4